MNKIKKHLHYHVFSHLYRFYSSKEKVFGIGLNKTGTSSLGHFFELLGYYHSWETYSAEKILKMLNDKKIMIKEANRFDMHEDWPWAKLYKDLSVLYKGARFILTLRDTPEQWFNSLINTSINHGPNKTNKIFYGKDLIKKEDKQKMIDIYNKHKDNVITFFNDTDRLLVLNTSDCEKEKKICKFLNIPTKTCYKYPHSNKGKYDTSIY